MAQVEVRPIRIDERSAWEPLWRGYQAFYKVSLPVEATDAAWARFHDPSEPVYALGAYLDESLVGIVHYILHRSTWTPGDYCYLQDLFVTKQARGRRVGRALIEAVYERARQAGASRVYWLTHEDNDEARRLYDRVAENAGFIQYRTSM